MIDSGASGLFADRSFIERNQLRTAPLRHPIFVHNIDGSLNKSGSITHFVRLKLTVDTNEVWTDFLVTDLGGEEVILGLPWLRDTNPRIDWAKGLLTTFLASQRRSDANPTSEATVPTVPKSPYTRV